MIISAHSYVSIYILILVWGTIHQKETGIYDRFIRLWISIYITEGIEGLKNKIEYNKTQFKELFYKNIFSGYISHFFQYMKNLKSKIML